MTRLARSAVLLCATGGGAGYLPWAPGTWGTLVAVPLFVLLAGLPAPAYLALTLAFCLLAIPIASAAARLLQRHDPGQVVIDEIAGFLVTMALLPPDWRLIAAGFVLFRLLDIVKPWPANRINDCMPGGCGIVLDDIVAGLYAAAVLHAACRLLG